MALIVYTHKEQIDMFDLPLEKGVPTYIKKNGRGQWQFTTSGTIQKYQAQIMRADNGFYAIIASREQMINVNDVRVYGLHVLRDTDHIHVGDEDEKLRFYEWVRQTLKADSKLVNIPCAFCQVPYGVGDQVIFCPKCDTPMHEYCWATRKETLEGCILPNCGYLPPKGEPYAHDGAS